MSDTGPREASQRINSRVRRDANGCLIYLGRIHPSGYGMVWYEGRHRLVHRLAWELVNGPIPDGLVMDHLCRNPSCINLEHLEPVTTAVNVYRGIGPSAINRRKTHCNSGHVFDEANTYFTAGKRHCRECRRLWQSGYRAQKRAAAS